MAMSIDEIQGKKIFQNYKEMTMRLLPLNLRGINQQELENAIDYSISKRYKSEKAEMYNNYTNKKVNTTLLNIIEYILKREPICCASGVMFKNHAEARNPLIPLITSYLDNRKKAKKTMFTFPKGSEDFEKYNLLQLLYKIDCNSLYGLEEILRVSRILLCA